jgi:hypothetical protein
MFKKYVGSFKCFVFSRSLSTMKKDDSFSRVSNTSWIALSFLVAPNIQAKALVIEYAVGSSIKHTSPVLKGNTNETMGYQAWRVTVVVLICIESVIVLARGKESANLSEKRSPTKKKE